MLFIFFLVTSAQGLQRLTSDVHPIKYHLVLHPTFEPDFLFQGNLSIQLAMNNTDTFSLDCEDLNITSTSLVFDNEWTVSHQSEQKGNRLVVKSKKVMKINYQVEFNVTFQGRIRTDLFGFYYSKYEYNGKQSILGSTQFESTGARKAFPCFDEPSFRSDFSLEILVDSKMNAISNQPAVSNDVKNGLRRIIFAERPSIPTYLIAWIIYQTDSYGKKSTNIETGCYGNSSIDYSIWYDLKYENETALALNVAPKVVSALENFTGIHCEAVKYKLDIAAIPDFQAGAMENWEIITFRESALLYNDVSSSIMDKQSIVMILAHELAHQWFGNLVTPQWWSYIWLNEGFARYLQYIIADQLFPEMKLVEQFLVDRRQIAFQNDDFYAHSLTYENITSEDKISDMFDTITYDKGASVIHMWRSTIGYGSFQTRINKYLTSVVRSGGVSNPEYLFSALFDKTDFANKQLGSTWTEQNRYPIVVVNETNSTLVLKQIKVTGWNTTEDGKWLIPIMININNYTTVLYNMEPNKSLNLDFDQKSSYIINVNQTGYYRVMYRKMNRWLPSNVSDLTRSMLIDDALSLSKVGLLSYSDSLAVTSHHLRDIGYLPWVSALRAFSTIHDDLKSSEIEQNWKEFVLNLMNGVMEKVALNNSHPENHISMLHKVNLLKHGCNYGHKGCLIEANKLASNLSYGTPEKRNALLCTVVRHGNDRMWNQIYGLYNSSTSPTEKQLYLKALTCTLNRTVIQKFLQLMLTRVIRKQDVTATISLICESPQGAEETLSFFVQNYKHIYDYFGNFQSVKKILLSATKFINDSQLIQVKKTASVMPELNIDPIIYKLQRELIIKKRNIQMIREFFFPLNHTEVSTEMSSNRETPDNSSSRTNAQVLWIIAFLAVSALKALCDVN